MRWLLLAQHLISDRLLEKGTVVGDDTPHPIETPTMLMAPLDDDAMAKSKEVNAGMEVGGPGYATVPDMAQEPPKPEPPPELPSEEPPKPEPTAGLGMATPAVPSPSPTVTSGGTTLADVAKS